MRMSRDDDHIRTENRFLPLGKTKNNFLFRSASFFYRKINKKKKRVKGTGYAETYREYVIHDFTRVFRVFTLLLISVESNLQYLFCSNNQYFFTSV